MAACGYGLPVVGIAGVSEQLAQGGAVNVGSVALAPYAHHFVPLRIRHVGAKRQCHASAAHQAAPCRCVACGANLEKNQSEVIGFEVWCVGFASHAMPFLYGGGAIAIENGFLIDIFNIKPGVKLTIRPDNRAALQGQDCDAAYFIRCILFV